MKMLITVLCGLMLSGCSAVDVRQYADRKPELDLYDYFQGKTTGWGIVQDRKGVLLRQFVVRVEGTVAENSELILEENFVWSDGEIQHRTWTISAEDSHNFIGTANDVVGTAIGELYGNVLNWKYRLNVKVDNSTYNLHFDDWMFLQPNDVLLNRTKMSKFGFHLGDITIVFNKNTGSQGA